MIRNLILTLLVIFCAHFNSYAQNNEIILDCEVAQELPVCDLQDFDDSQFTNPDPANANPPGGDLCGGGVFNNPGWISFVTGSTDIEVTISPLLDDITGLPLCDTVPGGQTGIQVALWEGCPDAGGNCVAGDANCSDQPITLTASGLDIGQTYNLTIDGCAGSVCTVSIMINSAQA
ncbi:MAG: hypothetical protein KJO29_09220, partial [Bacteroidia bacterium]|nr:hypothetical protein [Bacteroidia bacterium]